MMIIRGGSQHHLPMPIICRRHTMLLIILMLAMQSSVMEASSFMILRRKMLSSSFEQQQHNHNHNHNHARTLRFHHCHNHCNNYYNNHNRNNGIWVLSLSSNDHNNDNNNKNDDNNDDNDSVSKRQRLRSWLSDRMGNNNNNNNNDSYVNANNNNNNNGGGGRNKVEHIPMPTASSSSDYNNYNNNNNDNNKKKGEKDKSSSFSSSSSDYLNSLKGGGGGRKSFTTKDVDVNANINSFSTNGNNQNLPEWFRMKQEEADRIVQELSSQNELQSSQQQQPQQFSGSGGDDTPEWLEDRLKIITGDMDDKARLKKAKEIRKKQKELFSRAARGEISISKRKEKQKQEQKEAQDQRQDPFVSSIKDSLKDKPSDGNSNVMDIWDNDEEKPDWMIEQSQTSDVDAWIRKREEESRIQSMRESLINDNKKEKEKESENKKRGGVAPDWLKQKELDMLAKIEERAAETIASSQSSSSSSSPDNVADGVQSSESRSSSATTKNEKDDWFTRKEKELSSSSPSVEESIDSGRDEILNILRSSSSSSKSQTSSSSSSTSNGDKKDNNIPDTPFFSSEDKFKDANKHKSSPSSSQSSIRSSSVIDSAPNWLRNEMNGQSTDDVESSDDDILNENESDLKEVEDSYMFRNPSVDWIRSDPIDFESDLKRNVYSNFEARWKRLLESSSSLSVAELNGLMDDGDAFLRLRIQNQPDSAHGAIFRLEGALIDISNMQMEIWTKVADKFGYRAPFTEDVARAQMVPSDEAVRRIFYWTQDMLESREIAFEYYDLQQQVFNDVTEKLALQQNANNNDDHRNQNGLNGSNDPVDENFVVVEGAHEWLTRLEEAEVPCCVVTSQFDDEKLDAILNITALAKHFPKERRVSGSNGYDGDEQEFLGAALRIQRRPDHCAVFEATPEAARAAHEVEMRSISLMTLYPMYELRTADMVVETFEDLSVVDVRRLFWDVSYEPEVQLERVGTLPDELKRIKRWVDWDYKDP